MSSDLILVVGDQTYVHKFVLITQSEVFSTMLMDRQPAGRRIQLNESPECEQVFSEFLKYFYTHPANFPLCDTNIFAVHMLAEKYAMKWLKMDAEKVMQEILDEITHR